VRRPSENKLIQRRAKSIDPDEELELVIVQSMWLTGFDSPPLHTMYVDKPMRGAALMQALSRVNRTFRGKQDGLLVGYAPLTENLHAALAHYTPTDQATRPLGRDIDEAIARVQELHGVICDEILVGYDWRGKLASRRPAAYRDAVLGTLDYLRDPGNPGNQVSDGEPSIAERFKSHAARLARFYALCSSSGAVREYRADIALFEEVRVWMAKFDAEERRARGLSVPADIELYLRQLTAGAIEAGGVTDIYQAAGIERPDLSHLDDAFIKKMQEAQHPHLAIEALRRLVEQQMRLVTRHNLVRQQSFSDRLSELMKRYTNQHLTTAEIIAELVAMSKEVSADAARGRSSAHRSTPTSSLSTTP